MDDQPPYQPTGDPQNPPLNDPYQQPNPPADQPATPPIDQSTTPDQSDNSGSAEAIAMARAKINDIEDVYQQSNAPEHLQSAQTPPAQSPELMTMDSGVEHSLSQTPQPPPQYPEPTPGEALEPESPPASYQSPAIPAEPVSPAVPQPDYSYQQLTPVQSVDQSTWEPRPQMPAELTADQPYAEPGTIPPAQLEQPVNQPPVPQIPTPTVTPTPALAQPATGQPQPVAAEPYHQQFDTFQLPPVANQTSEPSYPANTQADIATSEPEIVSAVPVQTPATEPNLTSVLGAHIEAAPAAVTPAADAQPPELTAEANQPQGLWQHLMALPARYHELHQKVPHRIRHAIMALIIGFGLYLVFNSQIILGQIEYLTNAGVGEDTPVITQNAAVTSVSAESRVIIPKINVNVPVVYDEPSFDEHRVQRALERGVVHYGATGLPGQPGNNVIVGHSSNNWWASGKYKFAFVLLDKLEKGDTLVLHYAGQQFIYEVSSKITVDPSDFSVLQATAEPTVTLITCTPPGTSWKRLVVQAKQISPKPAATAAAQPVDTQQINSPLPGNTPSLWDKFTEWLFGNDS